MYFDTMSSSDNHCRGCIRQYLINIKLFYSRLDTIMGSNLTIEVNLLIIVSILGTITKLAKANKVESSLLSFPVCPIFRAILFFTLSYLPRIWSCIFSVKEHIELISLMISIFLEAAYILSLVSRTPSSKRSRRSISALARAT